MRGVRLAVAAYVAALAALTSVQALAIPDLRSLLLAPSDGARWVEGSPGDANLPDGPMNAHDFAGLDSAHQNVVLDELSRFQFVAGYQRSWLKQGGSIVVYESMKVFKLDSGATGWYDGARDADRADPSWTRSFDTPALPNSYGNEFTDQNGVRTTVVIRKGNDIFHITYIEDGPDTAAALSLAQAVYAAAPQDSLPQPAPAKPGSVNALPFIVIGAIAIAGLIALWVVVVRVARASRPVAHVGPGGVGQVSPDGRWWWDGAQWRPMAPPPPPAAPVPPTSA